MRLSCRMFRRWMPIAHDGELRGYKAKFVAQHRQCCEDCAELEQVHLSMSLLLRGSIVAASPSEAFDQKLISRWQEELRARRTLVYWSPTLIGASVAAIALLALLQLLTGTSKVNPVDLTGHEARRGPATEVHLPLLREPSRPFTP